MAWDGYSVLGTQSPRSTTFCTSTIVDTSTIDERFDLCLFFHPLLPLSLPLFLFSLFQTPVGGF